MYLLRHLAILVSIPCSSNATGTLPMHKISDLSSSQKVGVSILQTLLQLTLQYLPLKNRHSRKFQTLLETWATFILQLQALPAPEFISVYFSKNKPLKIKRILGLSLCAYRMQLSSPNRTQEVPDKNNQHCSFNGSEEKSLHIL